MKVVELCGDGVENVVDRSASCYGVVFAAFHVVVRARGRARVIYFQTVGYGLRVVVGSSGLLSAFDHAVDQFVVGYFESDNGVELRSRFSRSSLSALACGIVRGNPSNITRWRLPGGFR